MASYAAKFFHANIRYKHVAELDKIKKKYEAAGKTRITHCRVRMFQRQGVAVQYRQGIRRAAG